MPPRGIVVIGFDFAKIYTIDPDDFDRTRGIIQREIGLLFERGLIDVEELERRLNIVSKLESSDEALNVKIRNMLRMKDLEVAVGIEIQPISPQDVPKYAEDFQRAVLLKHQAESYHIPLYRDGLKDPIALDPDSLSPTDGEMKDLKRIAERFGTIEVLWNTIVFRKFPSDEDGELRGWHYRVPAKEAGGGGSWKPKKDEFRFNVHLDQALEQLGIEFPVAKAE